MKNMEPGQVVEHVDVVILMDVTGSMGTWIHAARETVLKAFNDLHAEFNHQTRFRLGLVCYRDYGDEQRFIVHDLTENVEEVQNLLQTVEAKGGDDTCEDIAGGLERVINIFKSSTYNPVRVLLFVADAPAHGMRYHTATASDRFPKGDPDMREPADQMRQLAELGVDTTLFRIQAVMDKMIEEFAAAYESVDSGTFTLLDVVAQGGGADASDTSGYVDLASYADEPVMRSMSSTSCMLLSSASPFVHDESETFYAAASSAVSSSVARRRERGDAK
jgi:hypothetical protein